jgi:hypothetical protein
MNLLSERNTLNLWQEVVQQAAFQHTIALNQELEMYLISLLIRYTNQPELLKRIMATSFLQALHKRSRERAESLQRVGDECLLITGLFPYLPKKRLVTVSYFVSLGQSAYSAISYQNELFNTLSVQFVSLMDVLRCIPANPPVLLQKLIEQKHKLG